MDTYSFVRGNTVLYFVLLPDRNISESIQRFQWVIPEDSVTFQHAERAPRLRPGRGHINVGRLREERAGGNQRPRRRWIDFDQVLKKKNKRRNKAVVQLRKLEEERMRMWRSERKDVETEWECESTQLSGNPQVHTVFQSKSIDLAGLWQIIPAALHMTQSAWRIAFWWAIGLLIYQPNHPLMTASTRSLRYSKWKPKGDLEINSHRVTYCLKSTYRAKMHFILFSLLQNRSRVKYILFA